MNNLLICLLCAALLCSCHPIERVQERGNKFVAEYKELPDYESLPIRVLSWQQALLLMQKNNVELRQAYNNLEEARYQEKKIWRDWIPSLNFGQYYNRKLFPGGSNTSPNESQWSYNVIFNFPSIMDLPVKKYTTALAVFKAQKDIELKQRELAAQLYQLFLNSDFRERQRRLSKNERPRVGAEQEQEAAERKDWLRTAGILNDHSARWRFVYEDAPRVKPDDYREALEAPSELTIVQMALQAEASRLQQLGIMLQFWPRVQIDFYSPTLFNSRGGQMSGFMKNGEDTRVNMNMFVALDTQGQTMQSYRTAKESHEQLMNTLREKMWEHKEKTAALVNSWKQYEAWKNAMTAYMHFRSEQGAEKPEDVLELHADSLQLRRELDEQERDNMERVCSLVQEYGFPPVVSQAH